MLLIAARANGERDCRSVFSKTGVKLKQIQANSAAVTPFKFDHRIGL